MKEELRDTISQTVGGEQFKPLTGLLWDEKHIPFELFKFEGEVEYDGNNYHCILIVKYVYYEDEPDVIDQSEDIYFEVTQ